MSAAAPRIAPHLETILDRLAEAVTVQDTTGALVYANQAAARLLGFERPEDLLSAGTAEIMAAYEIFDEHGEPLDLARLPGRRALAGEEPEPLLVEYVVKRTGGRRWTITKATPIEDGDGNVLFAANIVEDVTEIMRTEHEQRHIATTLQRSLLPPHLPDVPGLVLAARFRSAEAGTEVGGDFYDVFPAGDAWYAVMGDVTGKGPAAAAVTGLARYTLRTAAMYEDSPSAVLDRLNTTLLGEGQHSSAACARLERVEGGVRMTVSCAGHPMPFVLRPDASPAFVGTPGTLGGAFDECVHIDQSELLRPGDTLLLYTDGVTDARGAGGRFELRRLVALLTEHAASDADTIVDAVDAALRDFQVGPQRDDVALLALQVSR